MSLREQLARKRASAPVLRFPLGAEGAAAARALAEAEQHLATMRLLVARGKDTGGDVEAAEARVREAQAAVETSSLTLRFRGLTEDERDALLSEHTRADDGDGEVDRRGFLAAALAVAVVDEDNLSAQEWSEELSSQRWTAGDVAGLFRAVVRATNEEPASGIPFG